MIALKIARYVAGIWLDIVFGPSDKTVYVSRTGTDR